MYLFLNIWYNPCMEIYVLITLAIFVVAIVYIKTKSKDFQLLADIVTSHIRLASNSNETVDVGEILERLAVNGFSIKQSELVVIMPMVLDCLKSSDNGISLDLPAYLEFLIDFDLSDSEID